MSKIIKKHIDLDFASANSLKAEDIPVDATDSIKDRLDASATHEAYPVQANQLVVKSADNNPPQGYITAGANSMQILGSSDGIAIDRDIIIAASQSIFDARTQYVGFDGSGEGNFLRLVGDFLVEGQQVHALGSVPLNGTQHQETFVDTTDVVLPNTFQTMVQGTLVNGYSANTSDYNLSFLVQNANNGQDISIEYAATVNDAAPDAGNTFTALIAAGQQRNIFLNKTLDVGVNAADTVELKVRAVTGADLTVLGTQQNTSLQYEQFTSLASVLSNQIKVTSDGTIGSQHMFDVTGGTVFGLPLASSVYDGNIKPFAVRNLNTVDITVNTQGGDMIQGLFGPQASFMLQPNEVAILFTSSSSTFGVYSTFNKDRKPPENTYLFTALYASVLDVPDSVFSFNPASPLDGDYEIEVTGNWTYSQISRMFHAELKVNGAVVQSLTIKPIDTGSKDTFILKRILALVGNPLIEFNIWSTSAGDISTVQDTTLTLTKRG